MGYCQIRTLTRCAIYEYFRLSKFEFYLVSQANTMKKIRTAIVAPCVNSCKYRFQWPAAESDGIMYKLYLNMTISSILSTKFLKAKNEYSLLRTNRLTAFHFQEIFCCQATYYYNSFLSH